MNHVRPGKESLKSRRSAAFERLETHLKNHQKAHSVEKSTDSPRSPDEFASHDKTQHAEMAHLKELGV